MRSPASLRARPPRSSPDASSGNPLAHNRQFVFSALRCGCNVDRAQDALDNWTIRAGQARAGQVRFLDNCYAFTIWPPAAAATRRSTFSVSASAARTHFRVVREKTSNLIDDFRSGWVRSGKERASASLASCHTFLPLSCHFARRAAAPNCVYSPCAFAAANNECSINLLPVTSLYVPPGNRGAVLLCQIARVCAHVQARRSFYHREARFHFLQRPSPTRRSRINLQ